MNRLQVAATSATVASAITVFVWRYVVPPTRRIARRQEEFRRDRERYARLGPATE